MNVVVVSIDRLHAGYLGFLGNSWVATPHFNRLAAESFVFDQATTDRVRLDGLIDSWWRGRHALETAADQPTLAERLGAAGFATCLISDESHIVNHPLAKDFAERVDVGECDQRLADLVAHEIDETRAAALFAAAAEQLAEVRPPFFCWIHSQGLGAAWDAPDEFRQRYAEEDERPPPRLTAVPTRRLTGEDDPDEIWGICQSYAGQVSLIDTCLGGLLESLDGAPWRHDVLLVVVGTRGFPLGRNGRLGPTDDALYSELIHVPWLVRWPDGLGAACRSLALVQPCDLAPTLADAVGLPERDRPALGRSLLPIIRERAETVRDRICMVNADGERAIRTSAWHLRMPRQTDEHVATGELYAKPDDRWDQNDVADRCPDVVEGLHQAMKDLESGLAAGTLEGLPPLSEALVSDLP